MKKFKTQKLVGDLNIAIGPYAAYSLTSGSRNFLMGRYAGYDLTTESDVIIIGDNIRSLKKKRNKGIIYIGDRAAVGKTLFGRENSLYYLLKLFVPGNLQTIVELKGK